jgi:hypothetical protein
MKRTFTLLTIALLAGVAVFMLVQPAIAPVATPREFAFGWVDDPAAVRRVQAKLPCPRFDSTEAFRAPYAGPDDVFLWDACRKATGDLLPPRDQGSVGSCVGFGTAAAIEHLLCVQIAQGSREEFKALAQEVIYGGSRVEIGRNQIRGDGSTGAWAAKFVTEYGVLPRGQYPGLDLTTYNPATCRSLGSKGLEPELERLARQHPVKTVSNVKSFDEAKAAIRNGYPISVCSNQGFSMQRDAEGFARPQGNWSHCMALVGVCGAPRPGGFLLNSWGANAHTGPAGPGRPSPAGFWADARTLDRMLAQGDSWAFSHAVGFPARKLDWYARINTQPTIFNGGQ